VKRLDRLPLLLCLLLALSGAALSAGVAWVQWIGTFSMNPTLLERWLPLAASAGLPTAPFWLRLAELYPDSQQRFYSLALAAEPRCLPARLGLALAAEFAGNPTEARLHIDTALSQHKTYRTFMAALTQAARWGETDRTISLARQALRYCPRDADGLFSQLTPAQASSALNDSPPSLRQQYFRFLLGQQRWRDALAFSKQIENSAESRPLRFDLAEQLFWLGEREAAATLFAQIEPEFARTATYNLDFSRQPSSLAFDWRLTGDPAAQLDWRPGQLAITLKPLSAPLPLISLLLDSRRKAIRYVRPVWTGETSGLIWQITTVSPGWQRAELTAPPGPSRAFTLSQVSFE
jgi:hypothetical protein